MASKTDLQDILKDQYGINKNITQSLSQDECDQLLELLSNTPSVDRLVAAFVQKNNELSVNNRTFGQQRSNAQKRLERLMKEHQQLEDIIAKQEEKNKVLEQQEKLLSQEEIELQRKIEALNQRNQDLESKVQTLITRNDELVDVNDQLKKENKDLKNIVDQIRLRLARDIDELLRYEDSELRKAMIRLFRWTLG